MKNAVLLVLLFSCSCFAQETRPYTPSLDPTSMDRSVDPCVNFFQYACGAWNKKNPIPADRTEWSVYSKTSEDNLVLLRSILEKAASAKDRDAVTQKVGDFYGACIDESAVNRRGLAALKSEIEAIKAIKSVRDIAPVAAHLQLAVQGSSIMFGAGSQQDFDDAEKQIAAVDQGGLGLPNRDYYTTDDAKSKEIREHYMEHLKKVFSLMGDSSKAAAKHATIIMRIETGLARASLTSVERRDPHKLSNKMTMAELIKLAPNFDWETFFHDLDAPRFEVVNVSSPGFLKQFNRELKSESLANWRDYLRFELVNAYEPYLSEPFVQEDFLFYSKYLRGAEEIRPRWKRCVRYADRDLGEALGQAYVRAVFPPEMKKSTSDMLIRIEYAMEMRIHELDWMSPETKQQALVKLHGVRNKIGYPDKWRDYGLVNIVPDDFAGNVRNAIVLESHRELNKIGSPIDRGEWDITPPTVDAYYNPQMNDINFPAGVLQPPLYDAKLDDAPNYGDTGSTIGHELTHGFDDEGRQFDSSGNLKDWWTKDDSEKFSQRAQCVSDQYAKYVVVDDVHINSKLTLGEDIADLGGTILAYLAWQDATKDKHLHDIDGLTPEQRYFLGFAQWDCGDVRPAQAREWAITDPHSPNQYRINGVLVNMPQFGKAFSCKAGQPMVKAEANVCHIW